MALSPGSFPPPSRQGGGRFTPHPTHGEMHARTTPPRGARAWQTGAQARRQARRGLARTQVLVTSKVMSSPTSPGCASRAPSGSAPASPGDSPPDPRARPRGAAASSSAASSSSALGRAIRRTYSKRSALADRRRAAARPAQQERKSNASPPRAQARTGRPRAFRALTQRRGRARARCPPCVRACVRACSLRSFLRHAPAPQVLRPAGAARSHTTACCAQHLATEGGRAPRVRIGHTYINTLLTTSG